MCAAPLATPVTVPATTVATRLSPLDHAPPPVASDNVIVAPAAHTDPGPVKATGTVLTVTGTVL